MVKAFVKRFGGRDGYYYREWKPEKVKRTLVLLHGIESHSLWFEPIATLFAERGFHVFALDRCGSGLNRKNRGHTHSYCSLLSDIRSFIKSSKLIKPLYLGGLSWGGKLATIYLQDYPYDFDGLILISPGTHPRIMFPFIEKMSIFFSAFFNEKKRYLIPIDKGWFTSNRKFKGFIEKDAYRLKYATARFFFESEKMSLKLTSSHTINIPVFLAISKRDKIVDTEKVKKYFNKVSGNLTVKKYQNDHSLQFEVPNQLVNDVYKWIRRIEK